MLLGLRADVSCVFVMNKENLNRFFIAVFFLVISYLSFMILQGFLMSILVGAVIAYMLYPVYSWFVKRTGSTKVSAMILSLAAVFVLISIFILVVLPIVGEFDKFYRLYVSAFPETLEDLGQCTPQSEDLKCKAYMYIAANIGEKALQDAALSLAKPISEFVINNVVELIKNLPNLLLQFTVILFSTFYFLINGEVLVHKVLTALPLKDSQKARIKGRIDDVLKAVIYGNLLTAFIEGVIITVLFLVLDIDLAVIAGILVMVFALLPPLGAMIIWLPAVLLLFLMKEYAKAIILGLACIVVLGYIDNIGRPAIISKRVKLSFLWVLLGIFGGLLTFGFIGLIAGPLILSLFVTFLDLIGEELSGGEHENSA